MADRLRRSQDDDGAARPPHSPLRYRRDRQRKLALQEPRLNSPRSPRCATPTSSAGASATAHALQQGVNFGRRSGVSFESRLTAILGAIKKGGLFAVDIDIVP